MHRTKLKTIFVQGKNRPNGCLPKRDVEPNTCTLCIMEHVAIPVGVMKFQILVNLQGENY